MYHCRMTKCFCYFIFFLIFCFRAESQHATIRSRSELGFVIGGTYYIGDLNRMTSQFHRGGGGFLVKDSIISNLLINLISL